jgi:hypothetical protein
MLYVWKEKTQNFLQATCDLHLATNISNDIRQPEHYVILYLFFIFIASGILLHGRFMIRLHQSQIKVKSIGKIWISKVSYCSVCTTLEKRVLLLLCCSESVACSQWAADTKEKSVYQWTCGSNQSINGPNRGKHIWRFPIGQTTSSE